MSHRKILIVDDIKKINKAALKQAKENKANRIQSEGYAEAMLVKILVDTTKELTDES